MYKLKLHSKSKRKMNLKCVWQCSAAPKPWYRTHSWAYFAPYTPAFHSAPTMAAWNTWAQRPDYYMLWIGVFSCTYRVFSSCTDIMVQLWKTDFQYVSTIITQHAYHIGISLGYIVLDCLIFKIAAWAIGLWCLKIKINEFWLWIGTEFPKWPKACLCHTLLCVYEKQH